MYLIGLFFFLLTFHYRSFRYVIIKDESLSFIFNFKEITPQHIALEQNGDNPTEVLPFMFQKVKEICLSFLTNWFNFNICDMLSDLELLTQSATLFQDSRCAQLLIDHEIIETIQILIDLQEIIETPNGAMIRDPEDPRFWTIIFQSLIAFCSNSALICNTCISYDIHRTMFNCLSGYPKPIYEQVYQLLAILCETSVGFDVFHDDSQIIQTAINYNSRSQNVLYFLSSIARLSNILSLDAINRLVASFQLIFADNAVQYFKYGLKGLFYICKSKYEGSQNPDSKFSAIDFGPVNQIVAISLNNVDDVECIFYAIELWKCYQLCFPSYQGFFDLIEPSIIIKLFFNATDQSVSTAISALFQLLINQGGNDTLQLFINNEFFSQLNINEIDATIDAKSFVLEMLFTSVDVANDDQLHYLFDNGIIDTMREVLQCSYPPKTIGSAIKCLTKYLPFIDEQDEFIEDIEDNEFSNFCGLNEPEITEALEEFRAHAS